MTPEQLDEFVEILDAVAEQYGKTLSDGVKALYWQALNGYDLAAVREALSRHIKNPDSGMFMPKIADVIRMMQGSTQDSALSAWAKVDQAVRRVGTYNSVIFDDPLIHKVLHDMGGWMGLAQKSEDDWPFVAKEFENRYRGFKARNEVGVYPRVMIGVFEASNGKQGFKSQPPILIGNKESAMQVAKGGSDKPSLQFSEVNESTFKHLMIGVEQQAA